MVCRNVLDLHIKAAGISSPSLLPHFNLLYIVQIQNLVLVVTVAYCWSKYRMGVDGKSLPC